MLVQGFLCPPSHPFLGGVGVYFSFIFIKIAKIFAIPSVELHFHFYKNFRHYASVAEKGISFRLAVEKHALEEVRRSWWWWWW